MAEIAIYDKEFNFIATEQTCSIFFTLNSVTTFLFLAKPDVDRCFFFFNKELTDENMEPRKII